MRRTTTDQRMYLVRWSNGGAVERSAVDEGASACGSPGKKSGCFDAERRAFLPDTLLLLFLVRKELVSDLAFSANEVWPSAVKNSESEPYPKPRAIFSKVCGEGFSTSDRLMRLN